MITITKSITFKWKLSFNDSYKWTQEGELYNSQTMRKIKKTVNGYSIGYWISGKFYTIKNLRKFLVNHDGKSNDMCCSIAHVYLA